ncbi:hypothetical protein BpHYR1_025918 [Brachionus plicatilis]|uniref:Uncharacterized protein n=1 Tax=Brachionus plicatilis TaxID=10195 RepID=A0A3M7Q9U2_BRAPC|nr:hypothetical protein BpHYR1_025918 [Brachionus plicatilis]
MFKIKLEIRNFVLGCIKFSQELTFSIPSSYQFTILTSLIDLEPIQEPFNNVKTRVMSYLPSYQIINLFGTD